MKRASSPAPAASIEGAPPLFILSAHFSENKLHQLEDEAKNAGFKLTFDPKEARVFCGKILQKNRAKFELRKLGAWTDDAASILGRKDDDDSTTTTTTKRLKTSESGSLSTSERREDEVESYLDGILSGGASNADVIVLSIAWLQSCIKQKLLAPVRDHVVFHGTRISKPDFPLQSSSPPRVTIPIRRPPQTSAQSPQTSSPYNLHRREQQHSPKTATSFNRSEAFSLHIKPSRTALITQSTTEHDADLTSDLPEPPDWVKKNIKYSCQRSTPQDSPNAAFIDQLKTIRTARELNRDEIGVRAYSTAIAAVAAYPYSLTHPREITSLPGCDAKIAALFAEWKNYGQLSDAAEIDRDPRLKVLKMFYDIFGVGAHTANSFYDRGWRDLDDIVEFGWDTLTREQQIGVKFYDEFLLKMTRSEVESIAQVVERHVKQICGPTDASDVRICIVGGYRRGKELCSDADIMVSHIHDALTLGMVDDVVRSLHRERWITHNLKVYFSNTRREQTALPLKHVRKRAFDTLDKAFVVWQDPHHSSADGKNPNPHRRVDIIIAPWSKIGVAVTGWTSGTTFQRDLRRYAKTVKGWKFDSSGVRDVATGQEVDLQGQCDDIETAERRVFENLGLEWREPWERCTS